MSVGDVAAGGRIASSRDQLAAPPANGRPVRVLVVSGSVGAGHDGAATELSRRLRRSGIEVQQRDYLSALPVGCPGGLRRGYAASVRFAPSLEWLFGHIERDGWVRSTTERFCRLGAGDLRRWALGNDAVVSTFPLASHALGELKSAGSLDMPVATFLTDPAAHHLWVHPAVDVHLTVTPATAVHGEEHYGIPMRAAGPLVAPKFSDPVRLGSRRRLRAELGLSGRDVVVLVVAGSLGLGEVVTSALTVRDSGAVPLVLCGRNERLRRRLVDCGGIRALGWRADVPELMDTSDVLMHNAGGLSFTEALVRGLPAVTYAPIPGHGRANAAVLHSAGLAPWPRTPEGLATAIADQMRRGRRPWNGTGEQDAAETVALLAARQHSRLRLRKA